jgi:hypothetical protein
VSAPTTAQAQAICERLLGGAPERVEPYHPEIGGDDSYGFRLRRGGEAMVLKVKRQPGEPMGVYFHQRLKEAGLPVPELVAFSPDAGPGGETCAIFAWVEGRPAEWGAGESCPYDEAEMGELLRRIHDLCFDGEFGFLGDEPTASRPNVHSMLGPASDTWPGFFHCDRAARWCHQRGYIGTAEADVLAALPARLAPVFRDVTPQLLHMGDIMHSGNVIVHERGRIAAVIDYVESTAGDPRWELAWFDYYFTPSEREPVEPFDLTRFRAAYGTDHKPDDLIGRFYLIGILVFEKLLFYDPASTRGRWAIRTLKETLRAVGERYD